MKRVLARHTLCQREDLAIGCLRMGSLSSSSTNNSLFETFNYPVLPRSIQADRYRVTWLGF
jgi:hypothetical protein